MTELPKVGTLVRAPRGQVGRIEAVQQSGVGSLARLTLTGAGRAYLPLDLLAPVDGAHRRADVSPAVVRLRAPDLEELGDHLVRWHGVPIERAESMTLSQAFDAHVTLHETAQDSGYRLGHVHNLTQGEAEILEQGASAALRRST